MRQTDRQRTEQALVQVAAIVVERSSCVWSKDTKYNFLQNINICVCFNPPRPPDPANNQLCPDV